MMKLVFALSLVIAFLLGCVASQLAAPPARAQPGTQGKAVWSYYCFEDSDPEEQASEAGKLGWEMVAAAGYNPGWGDKMVWCFKQRVE